jgi:hypothetical protein
MAKLKDLTGKSFGNLIVIKFDHKDGNRYFWKCKCSCGNEAVVMRENLTSGRTKSCRRNSYFQENDYMVGKTHTGKTFIFDIYDYDDIKKHTWSVDSKDYPRTSILNKRIAIHTILINPDRNQFVDHINHNPLDNRRQNLRLCTRQQNNFNTIKRHSCISEYKGVTWCKTTNRWRAQISLNKKSINLGRFDNEIEAAKAYNTKAKELFGEFAYLNDI